MSCFYRLRMHVRQLLVVIGLLGSSTVQAQISPVSQPVDAGSGIARSRKISYTNTSLGNQSSSSFSYAATDFCSSGSPTRARRVLLTARFSANSLVDPGSGQPSVEIHNMGTNPFNGHVSLQLGANAGPSPAAQPIRLTINKARPEQTFVLDLTAYFNANVLTGTANRLTTSIVAGSYSPANPNFRLSIILEESYDFAAPTVSLPADIVRSDGVLEQDLSWTVGGCFAESFQIQLLKLTNKQLLDIADPAKATALQENEQFWRERATTLDVQTRAANVGSWRTTLAEGLGTYYYRVRAIATAPGGVVNPENWGVWSGVGKITASAGTSTTGLSNLNWIYSRTFTEGGRVAEKMTFANGLLQPRQTLTRLASSQQVIGLQTIQDFVGRDALQSLPIPIPIPIPSPGVTPLEATLNFKPALLQKYTAGSASGVPYQAIDFDGDDSNGQLILPGMASERSYYSGTAIYSPYNLGSTTAFNEGVPTAENYPFARTLFSRDGTNRVREQGSAGTQLGLKTSVQAKHTVRTFYSSVAQDELRLLMGKEAPLADKTFKVITTDPNNVSTVTYQTTDGKTVATALSGSGGGNLAPLASAPGQGQGQDLAIQEYLTDKSDYNGIGSVGRKILVVTSPTTANVTYRLDPKSLLDDCQKMCSTCDYQVSVIGYNMDEPTAPSIIIPAFKVDMVSTATCPTLTPINKTGSFEMNDPGTYVIEKKVTAYNSATGVTTTFLDDEVKRQQLDFEAYKTSPVTSPIWVKINEFLTPATRDIARLYTFLAANYTPTTVNGQTYYQVPFGCDDKISGSFIKIPVLQSNCGPVCREDDPRFARIFDDRWGTAYQFTTSVRGYTTTEFDDMIVKMLGDASASGYKNKCEKLRDCWTAQVESYDELVKASGVAKVDLAQSFLECAWSLIQPPRNQNPLPTDPDYVPTPYITQVIPAPTPILPADRYHAVSYDESVATPVTPTNPPTPAPAPRPLHLTCMQYALNNRQLTLAGAQAALATLTPKQATDFYECSRGSVSAPTSPVPATSAQAGADLSAKLQLVCEDRRGEFRQSVLAYIADKANGIGPNDILDCQVDLLADELMQQCKTDALLTATDFEDVPHSPSDPLPIPQKLTDAASKRLARIVNGTATVALRPLQDGSVCAPGFESCPVTPDAYVPGGVPGQTAAVRPTKAAFELISYANELVKKVNAINDVTPLYARGSSDLIKCPPTGVGFGESKLDYFNYIGPISGQSADNLFKSSVSPFATMVTPEAGRQNYWVTVSDDRWQGQGGSTSGRFGAYFFARYPNGAIADPSNLASCVATGDDAPNVPKLPILTKDGYLNPYADFSIYNPQTQRPINRYDIREISPPYAKPQLVNIAGAPLTSSQGLFVMVTTRDYRGVVARVEAEIRPVNLTGNSYTMDKVVWREVYDCQQPRSYAACLKWNDFVPLVTVIPVGLPGPYDLPSCQDVVAQQLAANIQSQQSQWISERLSNFRTRYAATCAAPAALSDELKMTYKLGYHHYTLYYYDRGGNLMKTVPPAGIRPLLANKQYPLHQLVTNYKYNSLNQLVEQTSPDGGTTNFYYNRKGQLRFSLNDKQRAVSKYSYTAYDALGRVIQVGESTLDYSAALTIPLTNIESPTYPSSNNSQVTTTVYTTPAPSLTYPTLANPTNPDFTGGGGQRYLNNRVSYSTSGDGVQTAYSYDPHGNVEWLAQNIPGLNEQKFVRYEYDLISNKVLRVAYQEGRPDQFFHRYKYDDDNRLLAVQTSADGRVWEQDAEYSYYAHGPLKRVVLGDDQVQALDYAYTLQGWLKAVNHPNLTTTDPISLAAGKDGQSNGVAADAFGMVLGYYRGDYSRTGTYLDAGIANPNNVLREPDTSLELFNGNIATWSSRSLENGSSPLLVPVAESYRYDQLNRLLGSERSTFSGSAWTASSLPSVANPTSAYATRYSYDANGNLQTLKRKSGSASQLLDDLSYTYNKIVDPASPVQRYGNQLEQVSDPVSSKLSDEDVDNQPVTAANPTNYEYDEVGNLRKDNQGGVANIAWTPYGKISQVTRTDGMLISYGYDAQGNRVSKSIVYPTASGKDTRTTYYVRDASGNMLAVYDRKQPTTGTSGATLTLVEQPLYGGARLGERRPGLLLITGQTPPASSGYYARVLGQKLYELTDHLGNVRAVVTDEKASILSGSTGQPLLSSIKPVLSAYYNYFPFGQLQPGRYGPANLTANDGYRFGYNGKEKDNNGELGLTTYDYGFRIYNPGLGRFLSVDPLASSYPWYTPYQFAGNSPLANIDRDGLAPGWVVALLKLFGIDIPSSLEHSDDIEEEAQRQNELSMRRKSGIAFEGKLKKQLAAQQTMIGLIPGGSVINGTTNVAVGTETPGEAAAGVVVEGGIMLLTAGAGKLLRPAGGYIAGRFGFLREWMAKAGTDVAVAAEVRVAKLLRAEGKGVEVAAKKMFATESAPEFFVDGVKTEVKRAGGVGSNLAKMLKKGAKQVGDGGEVIVVRGEESKASMAQMQDFINGFKPEQNAKFRLVDESSLPSLKK